MSEVFVIGPTYQEAMGWVLRSQDPRITRHSQVRSIEGARMLLLGKNDVTLIFVNEDRWPLTDEVDAVLAELWANIRLLKATGSIEIEDVRY